MATKERAGGRLFRFPRRDTVKMSRRALMGMAEAGVGFLLGGILAGAEIFGFYAPFGVAAVAAAGSGLSGFCTLAGSCLGYLCLEGMTDGEIARRIGRLFDLRPAAIIRDLDLRKPIYRQLAAYGHMGREDLGVKWENTDRVDALKAAVAAL